LQNAKRGNVWVDKLSTINISNTICDTELLKGNGNTKEIVEFKNVEKFNFELKTPNNKGVNFDILKKNSQFYK
jgi:hypothetical protein